MLKYETSNVDGFIVADTQLIEPNVDTTIIKITNIENTYNFKSHQPKDYFLMGILLFFVFTISHLVINSFKINKQLRNEKKDR